MDDEFSKRWRQRFVDRRNAVSAALGNMTTEEKVECVDVIAKLFDANSSFNMQLASNLCDGLMVEVFHPNKRPATRSVCHGSNLLIALRELAGM